MITRAMIEEHDRECENEKKAYGPGPWTHEPNRVEWESAGFRCLLVRSLTSGCWCGYVGVPPKHPAFGRDCFNIEELDVHGGLTYGASCAHNVCHITEEKDDLYWLGFDCSHAGDVMPMVGALRNRFGQGVKPKEEAFLPWEAYRDVAYARKETESLARQLAEMGGADAH